MLPRLMLLSTGKTILCVCYTYFQLCPVETWVHLIVNVHTGEIDSRLRRLNSELCYISGYKLSSSAVTLTVSQSVGLMINHDYIERFTESYSEMLQSEIYCTLRFSYFYIFITHATHSIARSLLLQHVCPTDI